MHRDLSLALWLRNRASIFQSQTLLPKASQHALLEHPDSHLAAITSWTPSCRPAATMRWPLTPLMPKELVPTTAPTARAVAPGPRCLGVLGVSPRRSCQSVAAALTCGFRVRRCITGGCAPCRKPCAFIAPVAVARHQQALQLSALARPDADG